MRCWLSFRCVRQATALYIWGLTPGVCPLVLSPVSSVPDVIHDHNDVGAQRALGVWASDSRLLLCTMFSMCIISIFVKISVGRKPVWGTFCLIRLWISSQLLSKECLSCTSRQNSKFCESRVYFLLYFLVSSSREMSSSQGCSVTIYQMDDFVCFCSLRIGVFIMSLNLFDNICSVKGL